MSRPGSTASARRRLTYLPTGRITSYEVDALALRTLVTSPVLQEFGSYGLTVVLGALLTLVESTGNSLDHYRRQVGIPGTTVLVSHLTPLARHFTRLKAGIEEAQRLLDRELARRRRGVYRTAQDQADIAAFSEATTD
jgi:hypothetical protein